GHFACMFEIEKMRNDDAVGPEIQCLLNSRGFWFEHLDERVKPPSFREAKKISQVVEIEGSVFDVENQGAEAVAEGNFGIRSTWFRHPEGKFAHNDGIPISG